MSRHTQLWDRQDLERRLCHALDVAKRTVELLAAEGYADASSPDDPIRPEKIISETALFLLVASTAHCGDEVHGRIRQLVHLIAPHARSERMLLGVCLEPALALDYAAAHIYLNRLGYPDPAFDTLLRRALGAQARDGRERVPHRMIEQEWLQAGWSGSSVHSRPMSSAARNSALNRPIDLLNGTRDDIYAFTHALMYVTDFNINASPLPRSRSAVLACAEAALAYCLDDQDYDLAGEVLLAWPLTGRSWSPAAAFGFRVLANVEDEAGFLPAPTTRLERAGELEGRQRTNYLLATAYHTVYVMGLLCAASLQPGRTPPASIPSRRVPRGASERILAILDADGRETHWCNELARLTPVEQDTIAGWLLSIALRRKTRQRDFHGVATLLREGTLLGLTDTPIASQSAEMLDRLALFAEVRASRRDGERTTHQTDFERRTA
ncbi:MAG TPA: hypothetical protein VGJ81_19300 [Thermoanaerobaculia bacterium]|jgi:hypothetical protein